MHLKYVRDAGLITAGECAALGKEYDRVGQMLWGLIRSIGKRV